MIEGKKVCLRVVTAADLPLLNTWENDMAFQSTYGDFGLAPSNQLEKRFAEDGMLNQRLGRLLIVTRAGEVVGLVSYNRTGHGPNDGSAAFNIGIVLAVAHRGKGYGVEAQQLLANYLFSTFTIMRLEAVTDVENIPEQRALEKAGFTREGILRKAQWRTGDWHDQVMYSKLRGE